VAQPPSAVIGDANLKLINPNTHAIYLYAPLIG